MPGQPEQIGPYKIVSELGHGGMGVVYKAFDPELERYVAVKCLAERFAHDESVATRFLREARSVAPLSHPNIVPVYTAGREDGQPYFVMEHVDGETLTERLQREHALPIAEAARIVLAAAAGLQAAHEAGVTHRDIKPSNLLLDRDDRVRIADFGIARIEGVTKLTQTGGLIGTPGYISPEAIEGEADDHRSDIFSLGVVFYEMLTGQMPFPQSSPVQMWRAAVEAKYPDVRELNAEVDDHTLAVLRRMLAADPKDRYQTCNELIEDVQPIAAESVAATAERPRPAASARTPGTGQPTAPTGKGTPPTQPTQQTRSGRRYAGIAVGVALIALAAVATGLLTWFSDRPPGEGAIAALTEIDDGPDGSQAENSDAGASGSTTDNAEAGGGSAADISGEPAASTEDAGGDTAPHDVRDDAGVGHTGDAAAPEHQDSAESGELAGAEGGTDGERATGADGAAGESAAPARVAGSGEAGPTGEVAASDEAATTGGPSSSSETTSTSQQPGAAADGSPDEEIAATEATTRDKGAGRTDDARVDPSAETQSKQQLATEEQASPAPAKTVASASAQPAGSQPAYRDNDTAERRGDDGEPTVVAKVTEEPSTGASSTKKQQQPPPPPPADKVAVLAAGDSAVARPLETALENALRRGGHDLLNERFVSGVNQHIGNRGVNLAPLRELLRAEGVGVLVVARIVPIGQRQLQYRGRRSTAYSSQIDLTVYDLTDGSRIDGWQNQFEFTSLNATEKARRAIEPYLGRLTAQLAAYRG